VPEYLTTSEVARYLRLNQKKIYALITAGELPAARVSGKWLFPKDLVDAWVDGCTVNRSGGALGALLDRILVLQGSDDWLLSRLIDAYQQRFGAAVPTATVGSLAGLSALASSSAHLASCHVSASTVREHARMPLYLFGLFAREQGIVLPRDARRRIDDLASLCRYPIRFAARQEGSGTARLVARLLAEQGLQSRWTSVGPYSSHLEVARAVRTGRADAAIGIRIAAELAELRFVPLVREEFDLAIPPSFMSHVRVREFLDFAVRELEAEARNQHAGYTFEMLGRLRSVTS